MKKQIIMILMGTIFPVTVMAGSLTVTNTFEANTPAVAADVNQNFTDVETAVNDNDSRLTVNEGVINSNSATIDSNTTDINNAVVRITANEGGIAANASGISTNAIAITGNASAISNNAADISSAAARITTNEGGIAANASGISTNAAAITNNASSISNNSADISGAAARITINEGEISTNAVNIGINAADVANNTADIATNSAGIATNVSDIATNSADIAVLNAATGASISGSVYRWNVFSTYGQSAGWYAGNDPSLFGGVAPSSWGDGSAKAVQMSADKEILRTLFTRKGYGGKNALVYANEWYSYSSTNSKQVVVMFRIKNTTATDIAWSPATRFTAYGGWSEAASIALNGVEIWNSAGATLSATSAAVTTAMQIPANRTSTVIFVSSSSADTATRSTLLAFVNDSLALPAGLEYVDDLDAATGDWTQ